jgi:phage terminase large subunit
VSASVARRAPDAPTPEQLAALRNPFALLVSRYQRDPVKFVREVLGAEPDPWQLKALGGLQRGHRRLSIRSGHGVGKSTFLAWVLLWFLLTRFPLKAVVTAPTSAQLFDALWAELRGWAAKLPAKWLELLEITAEKMALRARPDEAFISARTSRAESPESLQGIHSDHVLLVVDEASGVPERVFEAAGGSMSTPGAITILTGNPTRSNGFFWRTHQLERDSWFTMRVPSTESRRVDPNFCTEIAERYGIDSNAYRVRVLGEFPLADSDTLISSELVEQAMQRPIEVDWNVPEVWGVDVARFGTDQSVLIKRRGAVVRDPPRRWAGLDLMRLTGEIMNEWNNTAISSRPEVIVVDSIGLGAGVADRLRELKVPTQDVNVAETPAAAGRFVRMRDELWQGVADWLATRTVALPYDEMLRDDLCAPRYSFASDGRLRVESKMEMRSRGIRSPDAADALGLTFTASAVLAMTARNSRWRGALRRNIRGIV